MLFKTEVDGLAYIRADLKSKVKIGKNEFTVVPEIIVNTNVNQKKSYAFHVQDEKGDFEIVKVSLDKGYPRVPYDEINKRFTHSDAGTFVFTILTDVEFEKTDKKENFVKIPCRLFVSSDFMKALKLYEYCEDYIILPYHENLKFKYYIKKVKEESVEVCIENPFEIEIGGDYEKGGSLGKKEDYKQQLR
uniref:Uncharacterized protein n=1 Tax=Panagrolaimus superbus TaxID=310955 RepID=A0A914YIX6_9BILA